MKSESLHFRSLLTRARSKDELHRRFGVGFADGGRVRARGREGDGVRRLGRCVRGRGGGRIGERRRLKLLSCTSGPRRFRLTGSVNRLYLVVGRVQLIRRALRGRGGGSE